MKQVILNTKSLLVGTRNMKYNVATLCKVTLRVTTCSNFCNLSLISLRPFFGNVKIVSHNYKISNNYTIHFFSFSECITRP